MSNECRILVVEDHPFHQKLTQILLTQEGYRVDMARDAEEAHILLQRVRPHLIVMDIQLPGMDGLALTRSLKSHMTTCHIPILAVTACAMNGDKEKALEAGCDGYIPKPIHVATFIHHIQTALISFKQPGHR